MHVGGIAGRSFFSRVYRFNRFEDEARVVVHLELVEQRGMFIGKGLFGMVLLLVLDAGMTMPAMHFCSSSLCSNGMRIWRFSMANTT